MHTPETSCAVCNGTGTTKRMWCPPGLEHLGLYTEIEDVCEECGGLGHPNDNATCDRCHRAITAETGCVEFEGGCSGYVCTDCYSSEVDDAYERIRDTYYENEL